MPHRPHTVVLSVSFHLWRRVFVKPPCKTTLPLRRVGISGTTAPYWWHWRWHAIGCVTAWVYSCHRASRLIVQDRLKPLHNWPSRLHRRRTVWTVPINSRHAPRLNLVPTPRTFCWHRLQPCLKLHTFIGAFRCRMGSVVSKSYLCRLALLYFLTTTSSSSSSFTCTFWKVRCKQVVKAA